VAGGLAFEAIARNPPFLRSWELAAAEAVRLVSEVRLAPTARPEPLKPGAALARLARQQRAQEQVPGVARSAQARAQRPRELARVPAVRPVRARAQRPLEQAQAQEKAALLLESGPAASLQAAEWAKAFRPAALVWVSRLRQG
jgi:hypothetical protein